MGFKAIFGSLLACSTIISSVDAWDKDAHEAIGMTAMSGLNAQATAEVKRLMGGRDVVDIADWGNKVQRKFVWTVDLQTEMQPDNSCGYVKPTEETCPGNLCLVQAVKHFWGRLTQDNSDDYVELSYPRNVKLTDADQVKFLVSLLANMMNPMHLGRLQDRSGQDIPVKYKGKTASLYEVWDSLLVRQMIADNPGHWNSGWTHVNAVKAQYEQEKREFQEKGAYYMFNKWAEESAKYACENAYKDPITKQEIQGGWEVTDRTDAEWKKRVHNIILMGGARTAITLNALLEHQHAKGMQAGTFVKDIEDEDSGRRARVPGRHRYTWEVMVTNFLINLGLFSVVLGLFVFVERKTILGSNLHRPVQMNPDTIGRQ